LLAVFRINSIFPDEFENTISFFNNSKQSLSGFISADPDIRQDAVRYIVSVQKIYRDGSWHDVQGKVAVKMNLYPRYEYGQNIDLVCDLESPKAFEDFRYDKYMQLQGVWSLCQKPEIKGAEGKSGNVLFSFIYTIKSHIAEKINLLWHEPYASFVAGLLYGYRGGLGTLQEEFNRTGVTHIVAVSGFNISIIVTIFQSILLACFGPRKRTFWVVVAGLFFFVVFTGASASVLRAACMGVLTLLAVHLGRRSSIQNILIATVTVMAFMSPLTLIWDLSFQLSFLSTCGLIYFTPIMEKYLKKVPEFLSLRESLTTTLSAILFTLPLILFQFGRLSLVAPFVNILILPFIPYIMAGGFLTLCISFFSFWIAKIFVFFTFLALSYIVHVVHFFSELSFAAVNFRFSLFAMLLSYVLLLAWLCKKTLREK
jgi:competence protein ComEC